MRPGSALVAAFVALGACATMPLDDVSCQGMAITREATDRELLSAARSAVPALRDAAAREAVADALTDVLAGKLSAVARVDDDAGLTALARRAGPRRVKLNVLAMTTGGQYGAYGSGFLTGWSTTAGAPARPEFDVVTGASAGGIIAPLAFIGPEADPLLRLNVGISDADVIRQRPLFGLLGGSSIYATESLRQKVDAAVTRDLLTRIRAEGEDRRLFLGATNVTTGRFEVFGIDQYLTAEGVGPDQEACVIEAVMATSAIPVLFTPRSIDGQTYIDAGVRQHVFLEGIESRIREIESRSAVEVDVDLYVIVNGDLLRPAGPVRPRLLDVAQRSFSLVNDEGLRQSLLRTVRIAERNGWTLRAVRAPRVVAQSDEIFSKAVTTELYERGLADGSAARIPWLDAAGLRRAIED